VSYFALTPVVSWKKGNLLLRRFEGIAGATVITRSPDCAGRPGRLLLGVGGSWNQDNSLR
jgi:hypothetical protein